jgi:hypothetical protein
VRRFLVIFRSHAEGPADEHYVDVEAGSGLAAVAKARQLSPPPHGWAIAEAKPWPARTRTLNAAVKLVSSAP